LVERFGRVNRNYFRFIDRAPFKVFQK
jgi:hypothetical protein